MHRLILEVIHFVSRLFAPGHFGGIELFTREHYEKINGFTNMFWGWGAEDDDLYLRFAGPVITIQKKGSNFLRIQFCSICRPQKLFVPFEETFFRKGI